MSNDVAARACSRVIARAKSLIAASAVLAVAVTASSAAAAGSASASTRPITTASGVTWHKLVLLNGWQPINGSGSPAWALQNGVVYLTGSIHQVSGNNPEFAVLPTLAAPAHVQYIPVHTNNNTGGYLDVYPFGGLGAGSSPSGNARADTSLAGVSFPAAGTALPTLALQNGWVSMQNAFNTGDPSYLVSGGVVHLSGAMYRASGTSSVVAVLPIAARPASTEYIPDYTDGATTGALKIFHNGQIEATGALAQPFTSLAGVSFPAAGISSQKLSLINGWSALPAGATNGYPAYAVSHGVVYLSGALFQPGSGSSEFAVLPVTARPTHALYIEADTQGGSVGAVEIQPDGALRAISTPAANAQHFTSLAGISYPVNS
jgi:hypothetical protein